MTTSIVRRSRTSRSAGPRGAVVAAWFFLAAATGCASFDDEGVVDLVVSGAPPASPPVSADGTLLACSRFELALGPVQVFEGGGHDDHDHGGGGHDDHAGGASPAEPGGARAGRRLAAKADGVAHGGGEGGAVPEGLAGEFAARVWVDALDPSPVDAGALHVRLGRTAGDVDAAIGNLGDDGGDGVAIRLACTFEGGRLAGAIPLPEPVPIHVEAAPFVLAEGGTLSIEVAPWGALSQVDLAALPPGPDGTRRLDADPVAVLRFVEALAASAPLRGTFAPP